MPLLYLSEKQVVDLQAPYVQLQNSSSSSPLELFQMTETEIFWQKRRLQTQKNRTDPTEVFEQSSLPPRSSPGFFGEKKL